MPTYVGAPFEVATIDGVTAYGALMTKYGGFNWKLHDFGPGGGMGAPGIRPGRIKKLPMLTLGGKLSVAVGAKLGTVCAIASGASFGDNTRAAAVGSGVTCTYGHLVEGFTTTGCVGTRLTISGTSNELVDFSLDMFGRVTTTGAVTASGGATADFYPMELAAYGAALLGFTLTVDTGLVPVFAADGQGVSGWVNVGSVGATCTLQMSLSEGTPALVAAADAVGVTNTQTITLAGAAGGSLAISVTGYYSAIDRGEVGGILAPSVTLTGFGASMVSLT